MLMHNGRLSNPFDEYTRAMKAISNKRKKTDEDLAELAQIEARGGMYETEDGLLGLPCANVWRCIWDAAKAYKLGADVKRALLATPDVSPLTIDGSHQKCETYLSEREDRLLYVPVKLSGRVMRARAVIPAGWEADISFTILTDILQTELLVPVLERAGRVGGVGDWRPVYGTFKAEVI